MIKLVDGRYRRVWLSQLFILSSVLLFTSGCTSIGRPVGIIGHYQAGREALIKPRAIGADQAISYLEEVVKRDPLYEDTLTLLGRAYYKKERYGDARLILQRALAINKEDEIAWIVLGLAQLRLGDSERGLESLKGGITLFSKASQSGYRGYLRWDLRGQVRSAISRTVVPVQKGLEARENVIRSAEALLSVIDDEEQLQQTETKIQKTSIQ